MTIKEMVNITLCEALAGIAIASLHEQTLIVLVHVV